jgi:hypothetical protein
MLSANDFEGTDLQVGYVYSVSVGILGAVGVFGADGAV